MTFVSTSGLRLSLATALVTSALLPGVAPAAAQQQPQQRCTSGSCIDGQGTAVHANGMRYVGEFRGGRPNGFGILTLPDGVHYVGQLVEGLMQGHGILTAVDSSRFAGQFDGGRPAGYGVMRYANKDQWAGRIHEETPVGRGIYTRADNSRHDIEFRNGEAVNVQRILNRTTPASQAAIEAAIHANVARLSAAAVALGRKDRWEVDLDAREWVFAPAGESRTLRFPIRGTSIGQQDESARAVRIFCTDGAKCMRSSGSGAPVDRYVFPIGAMDETRARYLAWLTGSAVAVKELVAAPVAAPAPANTDAEQFCVIQDGMLRSMSVEIRIEGLRMDTLVGGRAFRVAFAGALPQYAEEKAWYRTSAPLTVSGRRYEKYGLPRRMEASELSKAVVYQGTPLFVVPGSVRPYEMLYALVRPGCDFQPYQLDTGG